MQHVGTVVHVGIRSVDYQTSSLTYKLDSFQPYLSHSFEIKYNSSKTKMLNLRTGSFHSELEIYTMLVCVLYIYFFIYVPLRGLELT